MRRIVLLLTAATGTVALLAFLYPSLMVNAADTTPPDTTITSGPDDTSDGTADFAFSSTEDGSTFKCKLVGRDSTRTKCTSPKTYPNLTAGITYTFKVWATDAAGNIDPTPAKLTFTPSGGSGGTDSTVLVGAGDISSGGSKDQETGNLVRAQLSGGAWGVFTTGDNAYQDGTYQNFQVYDAAWGSFRSKTRPTYGNHDYAGSSSAAGSQQYWNEDPDPTPVQVSNAKSFYAYDVANSNWRAIVLNSVSTEGPKGNQTPPCEDDPAQTNDQMDFLNRELNTTRNTVLFWHHARFSRSGDHPTSEGATGCSRTFFDVAYDKGADLVVQGHSHVYERYHARDKSGASVAGGLTSIVCGTGGNSFDSLGSASPAQAPEKSFTNAWGVCKLTLNANNAQVTFLPAPGSPGADSATVPVRP